MADVDNSRDVDQLLNDPNLEREWNAILQKYGLPTPEPGSMKDLSDTDLREIVQEVLAEELKGKPLEKMTLDELVEHEDDDTEDDREYERIRKQRIMELIRDQHERLRRYGQLRELTRVDFSTEVNLAPKDVWVVVHMYQERLEKCRLLNERFSQLAQKYERTKFLKIVATDCVPNFPDRNCPSVLVYCNNDLKKQWMGEAAFDSAKLSQDAVEKLLLSIGALQNKAYGAKKDDNKDDQKSRTATSTYNSDDSDYD